MKRFGSGSAFKRLGFLFILFIVVIYTVICVVFIQYVNEQKYTEIKTLRSQVTNSSSVMEQQLHAIYNMEWQLAQDSRLLQVAYDTYVDSYEKYQLISELQMQVASGQSMNSIIENFLIEFPKQSLRISSKNGYEHRVFDPESLDTAQSSRLWCPDGGRTIEMNIRYPLSYSVDTDYVPSFMIRILLSDSYMNTYLDTLRNPMQGAFWVLRQNGENICIGADDEKAQQLFETWAQLWAENEYSGSLEAEGAYEKDDYLFVSQELKDYSLTLVAYQNTKALFERSGYTLMYLGIVIIVIGMMFLFVILWANRTVGKPLYKVVEAFEKVRDGDLDVRIYHHANDEFEFIYSSFNETVHRIGEMIEQIKEQGRLLQNAELIQLQSQINPHFLYNSFYIIKFMAHNEDYEQIEAFVTSLAKYYRFLNKETNSVIALGSEVEHMENYIDIQQMRFGDKITLEKQLLPDAVKNFRVPKLILQPIIENAYAYGLSTLLSDGVLKISYALEDKILYIHVEDNGRSLTQDGLEKIKNQVYGSDGQTRSHALTNIHRRIVLAFGAPNGLLLSMSALGGLKVTLRLDTSIEIK